MTETIKAQKGNKILCKSWPQEAVMRMLMNNLNLETREHPEMFSSTKAARSREYFDKIIESLKELEDDATLIIQSGKPVGIFKTSKMAPRVLASNAMLVPVWATWDNFRKLEDKGLTMYDRIVAGNWMNIGSQGMFYEMLEVFNILAKRYLNQSLKGKLVVSSGMGIAGGALPLAVTANDGVALVVDVDRAKIEKRIKEGFCESISDNLDDALSIVLNARENGRALSLGLVGNAAEIYPEILRRKIVPDVVTDMTSSHDILSGYIPAEMTLKQALGVRKSDPQKYIKLAKQSIAAQLSAMLKMQAKGAVVFEFGNNIRQNACDAGVKDAFNIPGYAPLFIRDLHCEGIGPFRWMALSGDTKDIYKTEEKLLELFPEDAKLKCWIDIVRRQFTCHGLPARECWLGYNQKIEFGLAINEMIRKGEISLPVVIGRDYYDSGSAASPYGETEAMKDGSDAIADWPILSAILSAASGAIWVSVCHGCGTGIGYSIHSSMAVLADGSDDAKRKLSLVLANDSSISTARYADAGYEVASRTVKNNIKYQY